MLKKLLSTALGLCLTLFFISSAFAQGGTVTGKLTDSETGDPLPGANVLVVELNRGAATNANGVFTIEDVPTGTYTLRATFVGYKTKKVEVTVESGVNRKNIKLAPTAMELENVVVTAFGVQRQERQLGYSSQQVSPETISEGAEENFVNTLQGKVPGLQITQSSGVIGSSSDITLRGVSSLSGNNQPLFIVDGVYIDNSNFDPAGEFSGEPDYGNAAMDLNPSNIESINVLKGANAAALYGSKASNGAIVITTKDGSGSEGIGVDFNSNVMFSEIKILPDMQNQFGQTAPEAPKGNEVDESWGPPLDEGYEFDQWYSRDGEPEPWVSHPNNVRNFFETGVSSKNNLAVSGNYENTNFRLSVSNLQKTGVTPNTELDRTDISLNASSDISESLHADGRVSYISMEGLNRPAVGYSAENPMQQLTQWFGRQINMDRLRNYKDEDGNPRSWNHQYHENPYWEQYVNTNSQNRDRIIGNVQLRYDINDWINVTGKIGTDFYKETREEVVAKNSVNDANGDYRESVRFQRQANYRVMVNANRDLTDDFSLDFRAGMERVTNHYELNSGHAPALSVPGVYNLNNSAVRPSINDVNRRKRVNSVLGMATIGFRDYVYLDVSGRNDWSSTLPQENNSYFYPSASLSFIFTDAFDLTSDVLTHGKLRVAAAQTGFDTSPYRLQANYNSQSPFGSVPVYSLQNNLPNVNLKPEQKTSFEYGANFRFFDNRIGLDLTYYDSETTDQILSVPISTASGFDEQVINAGKISNKGIEASLDLTPVQTQDLQWDMTLNYSRNTNEVVELAPGIDRILIEATWDVQVVAEPGEEFGTLRGRGFKRNDDGDIIVFSQKDGLPAGHPLLGIPKKTDSPMNFGSYSADWTGSIYNSFSYKNFDLSFLIDVKQGGVFTSTTYMFGRYTGILKETLKGRDDNWDGTVSEDEAYVFDGGRWADNAVKADGSPNDIGVSAIRFNKFSFFGNSESHIFDASYVKLRQARLSYTLPSSLMENVPLRNVQLSLVGNNLWIIDKNVPHIDPETAFSSGFTKGLESNQLPSTRSYGFSVNVSL